MTAAADDVSALFADDEEAPPEISLAVTTTLNKDYMGRLLVNPTPGTSNAKDYMGRDVKVGNLDFLGRQLVA